MSDEIGKGIEFSFLKNIKVIQETESDLVQELSQEQKQKNENDYLEKVKQEKYELSGVGKKYLSKTLSDFVIESPEQKDAFDKVCTYINDVQKKKKRTLWMCGKSGTGKTLLASLIVRECGGKFVRSYEIANELDDCKSFKAKESKTELINRYSKYDVLVIDEVAKFESKQEIEYLFMILNERYEKMKSTVIVTNKSAKELREYLGVPIYDRFVENCISVSFDFESYRIKERGSEDE